LQPDELSSPELATLVSDMVDTLHHAGGIGLAAPQVNESIRLAIVEIPGGLSRYGEIPAMPLQIFVNPEIEILDGDTQAYWEGCLSIPGLRGCVERPQHIRVTSLDLEGNAVELELHGFLATVFQHEFDHLDGKLYVDRLKDSSLLVFEDLLDTTMEALPS
jgi:peptide deformylase